MNDDLSKLIQQIAENVRDIKYVDSADIPNINLYMDQVTTFMDEKLSSTKRYEDDKIMTKTMINNYAKNDLIPAPEKKKYSPDHMMILTFLYYYKNFLSISDISKFLSPMIESYYNKEDANCSFARIFDEVFGACEQSRNRFDVSVEQALEMAKCTFTDVPEDERDHLQLFSFISILGQDIYAKLMIMQRLIDTLPDSDKKK